LQYLENTLISTFIIFLIIRISAKEEEEEEELEIKKIKQLF